MLVLDGSEHASTTLGVVGDDESPREAREWWTNIRATSLYAAGAETRTHDAVMRIAAKLRGGGPILRDGVKTKPRRGAPPPRTVIGDLSQTRADRRENRQVL
jgi:hypothetical protein